MRLAKILMCVVPLAGSISVVPVARADAPAPQVLAAPDAAATTRVVRMRNMAAPIMAFLLDPKRQPEPLMFSTSRANSALLGDTARQLPSGFEIPDLPPGVAVIEVGDPQNSLSLRGSAADLDVWEKAIGALDKPLPQIEIQMQMVSLSTDVLKQLRVPTDAPGPHQLAFVGLDRAIDFLVKNQAKVVSAPRLAAIAGLTASSTSRQDTPVADPALPQLFIQQSIGMTVRPNLRPDGDIDMELEAGRSWSVRAGDDAPVPVRRAQSFNFRAQDGRSYLFYANPDFVPLAPNAVPVSGAKPNAQGKVAVYLVTARIIRRTPPEDQAKMAELIRQGRIEAAR